MTQTIEIKGGTIIKLLSVLIGLALMIFFLNSYDQNKKSDLLKKNIELLENSPVVNRIKNNLIGYDSLPHNKVEEIKSELAILKEETEGIYFYRPKVIFESEDKFLTISSQNHGYYNKDVRSPIDSKTEAIVTEIRKPDTGVFEVLDKANRGKKDRRIILPLTERNQKQAYLLIKYRERN